MQVKRFTMLLLFAPWPSLEAVVSDGSQRCSQKKYHRSYLRTWELKPMRCKSLSEKNPNRQLPHTCARMLSLPDYPAEYRQKFFARQKRSYYFYLQLCAAPHLLLPASRGRSWKKRQKNLESDRISSHIEIAACGFCQATLQALSRYWAAFGSQVLTVMQTSCSSLSCKIPEHDTPAAALSDGTGSAPLSIRAKPKCPSITINTTSFKPKSLGRAV